MGYRYIKPLNKLHSAKCCKPLGPHAHRRIRPYSVHCGHISMPGKHCCGVQPTWSGIAVHGYTRAIYRRPARGGGREEPRAGAWLPPLVCSSHSWSSVKWRPAETIARAGNGPLVAKNRQNFDFPGNGKTGTKVKITRNPGQLATMAVYATTVYSCIQPFIYIGSCMRV